MIWGRIGKNILPLCFFACVKGYSIASLGLHLLQIAAAALRQDLASINGDMAAYSSGFELIVCSQYLFQAPHLQRQLVKGPGMKDQGGLDALNLSFEGTVV